MAITMYYATFKTKLSKENEQRKLHMKISTYSIKNVFVYVHSEGDAEKAKALEKVTQL
jgi:hypothetical protein